MKRAAREVALCAALLRQWARSYPSARAWVLVVWPIVAVVLCVAYGRVW